MFRFDLIFFLSQFIRTLTTFLLVLNALFLWFGRLITNICVVKRLLGQNAIKCGDSAVLLNLLESLNFGFVDVNNDGAVDFVNLMQIADSALDELDEN